MPKCESSSAVLSGPRGSEIQFHESRDGFRYYGYRWSDPVTGRWVSRDPLEDVAFSKDGVQRRSKAVFAQITYDTPAGSDPFQSVNSFSFVANSPVVHFDHFGLEFLTDGRTALSDFLEQYRNMREANWKNSDKYFHCLANCLAASRGGIDAFDARVQSNLREFIDHYFKGDSKSDCAADQAANKYGRDCGEKGLNCKCCCKLYRPAGLPAKY